MKQSLQLKVGQQLTMTPQLQQAIKLLQLSTLDLQQEIQNTLEENPLLEQEEELLIDSDEKAENDLKEKSKEDTSEDSELMDEIPEDLPVDSNWDDVYESSAPPSSSGPADDFDFTEINSATESLQDHLLWQLNLVRLSPTDKEIGLAIIDAIDTKGRLSCSVEDLLQGFADRPEIEEDEVIAMLHRIQQFDPTGVGARDLGECLMIQLDQMPKETPWLQEARLVVRKFLRLLGNHDYAQLMRRARLKEHELSEVLKLIHSLHPTPGDQIAPQDTTYVVPDVFVRKHENRWQVELNPDIAPKLRINQQYASMAKKCAKSEDNAYIKDNLQEARWFLKSLHSRNETLMKVATKIVEIQQGFLDYGDEAMKPLVLAEIAEAVEMHESTISRVTTQKYMHTPRGIFELKYFFSSHVSTDSGGEASSTAIRALIKKLVAAEDTKKPLSDSKMSKLLAEEGIQVARRTVAKYRESMMIPPSNERKRLI